jgi:hypothetical protein
LAKPSYGWLPLSLHHKIDKRNIVEYAKFTFGVNLDKFILWFTYEMLANIKFYTSSYVSHFDKRGCNLLTIKKKNLAIWKFSGHLSSSYSVNKNLKNHVLFLNFPNDLNHAINFVENYTIENCRKLLQRIEVLC